MDVLTHEQDAIGQIAQSQGAVLVEIKFYCPDGSYRFNSLEIEISAVASNDIHPGAKVKSAVGVNAAKRQDHIGRAAA